MTKKFTKEDWIFGLEMYSFRVVAMEMDNFEVWVSHTVEITETYSHTFLTILRGAKFLLQSWFHEIVLTRRRVNFSFFHTVCTVHFVVVVIIDWQWLPPLFAYTSNTSHFTNVVYHGTVQVFFTIKGPWQCPVRTVFET